ncbi:MAG: Beta-lactamase hydrolase-like protein [Chroococcidiopsis cubana SAG 39.79]|uniref:Zn-dependent hydrolase n=1 Tax=Chroococcidiopsis cubana SAG 39.79 TaxID=388085 RepID=A0AB37URU2_9CYAN|nr:MBL fold metallo-hydrolase [Chroococcidiopsis cubana]MDZ4877913.1 Beta-lactamase hydrolase-like protein [Chroococcidiopsis cubana SAG 39.79]PSB66347.1 Zn-dependent hydrolase [Chroococcidiopsis cubana CCALA 043]RUT14180.1 Zn-dependent hydrolase [Chroococcidiopsis cubana SAG 39.79]
MFFRQLFDLESKTYTYLIADPKTQEAVLVDPVLEQVERDCNLLQELGFKLCYCLETHIHADHITGTAKLRELTGSLGILPEKAQAVCADRLIRDGEMLLLGSISIQAIATPGHTGSHMAYRVNNDRVLTGDALFIRGCGRTDFQGGDAAVLFDSVTQRLFTLPDETLVYPAHDYRGFTVSTIGEEKRWNPRFAGRDRASFIELMTNLELPKPQKMMEAIPANEHCGNLAFPQMLASRTQH